MTIIKAALDDMKCVGVLCLLTGFYELVLIGFGTGREKEDGQENKLKENRSSHVLAVLRISKERQCRNVRTV